MKLRTLVTGTAGAAALAVGALVTAPSALAVTPTTATALVNCAGWSSGQATLTVQQKGTAATITFTTPVVWASHYIPANSMETTLTLSNANGGNVTFTGKSNPEWGRTLGQPFNSGPLTGTVAPGDVLQARSLTSTVGTLGINCTVASPQSPGPFVF